MKKVNLNSRQCRTIDDILEDKSFVDWATEYLFKIAFGIPTLAADLISKLNRASLELNAPLKSQDWADFWRYVQTTSIGEFDIKKMWRPFVRPLVQVYLKPHNGIVCHRKNKRQRRRENKAFKVWANICLQKIYNEIILGQSDLDLVNVHLWHDLQKAAKASNSPYIFSNFDEYDDINYSEFYIDNPKMAAFVKPLRYMYSNCGSDKYRYLGEGSKKGKVLRNKKYTKDIAKKNRPKVSELKSDLETAPEEVIYINATPAVLPSKTEKPNFEKKVVRILTFVLKNYGWKWLSSEGFSQYLGIDKRQFETWAETSSRLVIKRGVNKENIVYYGLAPISFPITRAKMSTDKINGAIVSLPVVGVPPPAIGSDEFDTALTQFLSNGTVWRSSDALSQNLGHEKAAIESWADSNPSLIRRPSKVKGESKVYYALVVRIQEKQEVKNSETNTSSSTTASGTTTTKSNDKKSAEGGKQSVTPFTEREVLAFAMLHTNVDNLIRIMECYANCLATRHSEAFSHLTKAQKEYSSGVALLQKELKISEQKLPTLQDI